MTTIERPTLGRFELRGELGRGGFASVYRAWDPTQATEVALKVLHDHLQPEVAARRRFLREAQVASRLEHPNLVRVVEAGEADGRLYLVMELIDGYPLERRLREHGPLPFPEVAAVLAGLCPAVDALHTAGLVHRDITAANVLVESTTGRVVLGDFGIARALAHSGQTTETGIVGSWQYMAPERWQGDPGGAAADIYALGVLAYRLLTGQPPFRGDAAALAYAHLHQPPPALTDLRADLSAPAAAIIEQALAKAPAARPVRATDLAGALSSAASVGAPATGSTKRLGRTAAVTMPRIRPRRARHRPLGLVVAGTGALAGVLLLTGALANRMSSHTPEASQSPAAATSAPPELGAASPTPIADPAPPLSATATTPPSTVVTPAPADMAVGVAEPSPTPIVPPVPAPPAAARVTSAANGPADEAQKNIEEQAREAQKRAEEQAREAEKKAEEQEREAQHKADEQHREERKRDD